MANMILPGSITEVDYKAALVRVESGGNETEWLPYFQRRAWGTIDWDPPAPGESCLVLSPGGELSGGFVLTGVYSDAAPPPSDNPKVTKRCYEDGLVMEYDQETHTLSVIRSDGLNVRLQAENLDIETKKAAIRNTEGELIALLVEVLGVIAQSKTPTLFGPQPSTENAAQIPSLQQKIRSFIQ